MKEKWYAVQKDKTDEWGNGSYDFKEAAEMLRRQGYGLIAIIENDTCVGEISFDDLNEAEANF